MITQAQIEIMGADPRNATVPAGPPPKPFEPWSSPVMILAGMATDGRPWLFLAARCGWFLGFAAQHDPAALAEVARKHREGCEECSREEVRNA